MVLPKSMRLKGHKCFDHLYRAGNRYYGSSMVLRVVTARNKLLKNTFKSKSNDCFKCGIAISNKVSKRAVIRNRIRRLIHLHLSNRFKSVQGLSNKWALISLKPDSLKKTPTQLLEECDILLSEAGLFSQQ